MALTLMRRRGLRWAVALLLMVAVFLGQIRTAAGAIVAGTPVGSGGSGVSSVTWSQTIASGSNRLLLVRVANLNSNVTVTGVTYGGVAMTQLATAVDRSSTTATRATVYYLLSPAVGTANVVTTLSGSARVIAGSLDFTGVSQNTPFGTVVVNSGNSTAPSITVAGSSTDMFHDVVAAQGTAGTAISAGTGQTPSYSYTGQSATDVVGMASTKAGAASTNMTWSYGTSAPWVSIGVPIRAAGPSVSGTVFEDVNYGGGSGRSLSTSSGAGVAGATVELYDSVGTYVSSTTTAAGGGYSFSDVGTGTWYVRVVNSTVPSQRTGTTGTLRGVMTYRTNASSGSAVAVTDFVGGTNPALVDPGAASSGADFDPTSFVYSAGLSGTAQSVAPVTMGSSNISGIDFGFNFDTVVNTNDSGQGSLRQAITNANTLGGDASLAQSGRTAAIENLVFMISNGSAAAGLRSAYNYFTTSAGGYNVATITPATVFPTMTAPLVIDAQTQPGWSANPIVEVNGNGLTSTLLRFSGGNSTLRGFVINRLGTNSNAAVRLDTTGGNSVQGNWLGPNAAGSTATTSPRVQYQVEIYSGSNTIGGSTASARNVIGNAQSNGIVVWSGSGNVIQGNYLGTNAAGTAALGSVDSGIVMPPASTATGTVIGGVNAGEGNLISGNGGFSATTGGVAIQGTGATGTVIRGNSIGLNAAGSAAIASGGYGLYTLSANTTIGGTAAGAGNTITGYSLDGVAVVGSSATGVAIQGNSIYGNTGIGIDLADNGATANDGVKTGSQPNLLMDAPVFTAATLSGGTTLTVAGYVGSAANQSTFASSRVEIFRSDASSSNGSGQTYLGYLTADASGNFGGSLSVSGLSVGNAITGTATDTASNTSEFGANRTVVVGYTISGTVFEDANYGGGAGRSLAASSGVGDDGATVELYNGNGTFITSTTTAGGGAYSFTGLTAATYHVRVVNSTVASQRSGSTASLRGVMTYRTLASSGTPVAVTDYVGGTNPALVDPGAGSSGATFNTGTGVFSAVLSGTAQSYAPVTLGSANITGVDFGFNFSTIVNTNNSGQGSLRQFITNAATLGGQTSLAQSGYRLTGSDALQALPAGYETSIFMVPGGSVVPGLRSGVASQLTGGVASITLASVLPLLDSSNVAVDGSTQSANVGNANSGFLGTGGTVGADAIALAQVPMPEVQVTGPGGTYGMYLNGSNQTVRCVALKRFLWDIYIYGTGSGNVVEFTVLGASGATAFTDPGSSLRSDRGVYANTHSNLTVRNNLVGWHNGYGILIDGSTTGFAISGNESRSNGQTDNLADGITTWPASAGSITGNLSTGNGGHGIDLYSNSNSVTVTNNSLIGNGMRAADDNGIRVYGSNNTLDRNLVTGNYRSGINIDNGTGNRITRNQIYANGGVVASITGTSATTGLGIDLANNETVEVNNGSKSSGLQNYGMDSPVLTSASFNGSTLTVAGYVGSAANQSTFGNVTVEFFKSSNDSSGYGEGQTYLGSLTTNASGNFSGSFSASGLSTGDKLTATATDTLNNTSEFGANFTVSVSYAISGTVFEDVNYGGGAGRGLVASSGTGVNGATVELYNSGGVYVASTTTASVGAYSFTGLTAGTYYVRAVNSTVPSQRSGTTGSLRAVMTYRTTASSGNAVDVTDYVGGTNPALVDPGAGSSGATFNTGTGVFSAVLTGTVQSVAAVTLGSASIAGIDFGFNFDTVVNTNDSGQGSLRQAITNANTLGGDASLAQSGHTAAIENLVFMISNGTSAAGLRSSNNQFSGGVATISPASALPSLSTSLIVNAQTQPGWASTPVVELNGSGAGAGIAGLSLTGGSVTVRGLVIRNFTSHGLNVTGGSGHTMAGNHIGLNAAGTTAAANGSQGINVFGSGNHTIGGAGASDRNVVSGNSGQGINITGSGASGIVVAGNYVGTNAAGTAAVANGSNGVYIGASGNSLGSAGNGNLISGNTFVGVVLGSSASGTSVKGNTIGLNAAGTAALGNGSQGMVVYTGGNTLGGTTAAERNVIAANNSDGLVLTGSNATGNLVQGNYVGTNAVGDAARANSGAGVRLTSSATGNTVGGAVSGAGNLISGNTSSGVLVETASNTIAGNTIGLNAAGTAALANSYGVYVNNVAGNVIGGTTALERNVISGNTYDGVGIAGASAGSTVVRGNYIGTNQAGDAARGNGRNGVYLATAGASNVIGTAVSGGGNLIAGNGLNGVQIEGASTSVQGNLIGTNAGGTAAIANASHGIYVGAGNSQVIGGTSSAARNVISGNTGGIYVAAGSGHTIQGNYIGTTADGASALGNTGYYGVELGGSGSNLVGGTASGAGNVISGQSGLYKGGIYVASSNNTIQGNRIGTNAAGTAALANNHFGIEIYTANITGTLIGGTATGAGNTIAYNPSGGVLVFGTNTTGHAISRNSIYSNGSLGIGIAGSGRTANNGSKDNTLGNADMDTPVITSSGLAGGTLTVAGYVGSAAGQTTFANATVEVFKALADSSGYGQGQTWLGTLTANASGNFNGSFSVSGVTAGDTITATATDAANNTSEFSANATVGFGVSGTVFEDIQYGGGAGRSLSASGGAGIAGATVELYRATGSLVASTTTASNGGYTFSGLGADSYVVRVVTSTLLSTRSGSTAGLWPVQTWRYESSWQTPTAVTDEVGGQQPAVADSAAAPTLAWTSCAAQGATCAVTGTRLVRYGIDVRWVTRVVTGNVTCNNTVFGDPAVGAGGKTCEVLQPHLHSASSVYLGTAGVSGIDFGFNFDTVVNTNDSGQGSLRQALTNANTLTGDSSLAQSGRTAAIENLVFMISNGTSAAGLRSAYNQFATSAGSYNVATIAPTSALPAVGEALVIDAQTQPGWTLNPIVELNGAAAGSNGGLRFNVAGNTVRGLVINRFTGDGINLSSTGNTVSGNWIGTNAAGTAASANTVWGVEVNASSNIIGGSTAAARNVISGNGDIGIYVRSGSSSIIQGNYIGTNAAGTAAIANATYGVMVHSGTSSNVIGGAAAGQGNLISGNGSAGVRLRSGSGANLIRGNIIGRNAAASSALPNTIGIQIDAAGNNNQIGGTGSGEGNTIAGNSGAGVALWGNPASRNNAILGNSIYSNGGIGIDLGLSTGSAGNGITVNTGGKTTGEPNLLMNYPVLTGASLSGATLTVSGYVGSAAGQSTFASSRVEIFVSDNSSANGSGQTYLGYLTADASGNFSGPVTVPGSVTLVAGTTRLTGTATDTGNNTSEFGPNLVYSLNIGGTVFEDVNYGGGAGRSLGASGGVGLAGATVELYSGSGSYVSSTTTAGSGSYSFASLVAGSYLVRVVGPSVVSQRSGATSALPGVLTYRANGSSGSAVAVTDVVGGTQPALVDPGAASSGATLNPGTGVYSAGLSGTAQALAPVTLSTAGIGSVDFGFNFDTVVNTNDSGQGSLRQAITNANTLGGDASLAQSGRTAAIENLVFMIGNGSSAAGLRSGNNAFSGGVATITPASALPSVSAPLVLDAQTQPGWTLAPVIELNGSSAGAGASGFLVNATGSVVRGWVINRFLDSGVKSTTGNGLVIQGNYVGTTASGNAAAGNAGVGVFLFSSGNGHVIGGTTAAQRNVVGGNGSRGITISGGSGHVVQGNLIGVGADGSTVVGNANFGLLLQPASSSSTIGGTAANAANVIRGNSRGVQVDPGAAGIAILGNAIYGNNGLGINLGTPGPHANDGAKTAGQPNLLMDSPMFASARARGNQLTVAGYVGSAAGQSLFGGARVEIFTSDNASTGYGEGPIYLGYLTADASGNFSGTITMPVATLAIGTRLTGTATDTSNNTSEFGANFTGLIVDFVVNSNLDEVDNNLGDGLCLTASGVCTLRAAIAELNTWTALPTQQVRFALPSCPGSGCIIAPASALPPVSRAMLIDAWTQPGWTQAPIVELLGTGAGSAAGLNITSPGTTVRGLVIGGFGQGGNYAGIYINASNTTVYGNYIGLAADGVTARANGASSATSGGVYVASGTGVVIGGNTAAQRNVVSGNGGAGVWLNAGTATVIGNYIGTDASGAAALGNGRWGVAIVGGTGHRIGGATAGWGNVISGNVVSQTGGITVNGTGQIIQGNTIGLNAARTAALPNGNGSTFASGIDLRSGSGHQIGGTGTGEGNVIAGNQGYGVRVGSQTSPILGNSFYGNLWLGIDLNADGVTANNGSVSGSLPNNGMDYPVVTSAGYDGATRVLTLTGYVGTGTGQALFAGSRIEFFASDGDSSGYGEGRDFLGTLTADGNGRFSGSVTVPGGVSFAVGAPLTGTATDAAGNTSEFGPNYVVTTVSALLPSRFNLFETSTSALSLSGVIKTMTAGQARTLAAIAIDNAGSGLAPSFTGSVSLQWMDARDNTGALDAGGCRSSWVAGGSAGTASFVGGVPRMNLSLTPPAVGREWRLRMSHSPGNGSVVTACTTDNFAIKPASIVVTALGSADSSSAGVGGAARSLTNASASGGVVHRAGRPFALRAQGQDTGGSLTAGYDGTAAIAITGCVLPASGCTLGALQHNGGAASLSAVAGALSSDTMTYSEVGAITVRLSDSSFADIDAADSTAAERLIESGDITVGRFVPDRYATAVTTNGVLGTVNAACTAAGAGYTFFGQAFGWATAPQFTVTALNAQGAVTVNWAGSLQRLNPASHVAQSLAVSGVASGLSQTHGNPSLTDLGGGSARLVVPATASFALARDPAAPVASATPVFGWAAAIADTSEAAVTGNGSITGTAAQAGIAFSGGGLFHTGRLALMPGHGDARRGVRLLVELQRYSAAGWVTMTEDRGCVAVSPANVTVASPNGVFTTAGVCAAPVQAAATLRGGRAWMSLPATPGQAPGRLMTGLNLGSASSGLACASAGVSTASTPMNLPHLMGAWGGVATLTAEPRAALTWGRPNRDMVLNRERF